MPTKKPRTDPALFTDPTDSSEAHDNLVGWVIENLESVLVEARLPKRWIWPGQGSRVEATEERLQKAREDGAPEERIAELLMDTPFGIDYEEEFVVQDGKFILGFCDAVASWGDPILSKITRDFGWPRYGSEEVWEVGKDLNKAIIEAKTAIPHLGPVIRQIKAYRKWTDIRSAVVVCPDDRHQARLEHEGIRFVKAPSL